VISLAFSRDGARLVTGSYDGTLKIWDISSNTTTGQAILTLDTPAWPTSLAFDATGAHLTSASFQDQVVRVYALDVDQLAEIARTRVTRSLTQLECQKYLRLDQCP
jgi:WD40 repeat protein